MKFIIIFVFYAVNGDSYQQKLNSFLFENKAECVQYIEENFSNAKDNKFYCVESGKEKEFIE